MRFSRFGNGFILSCQPLRGGALDRPDIVAAYAQMGDSLGVGGLRIESLADTQAVRQVTKLPLIGLVKRQPQGFEVYITPELHDVSALAAAGADIIAFDATERSRPVSIRELVAAIHEQGCAAMADVSTLSEGLASSAAGADFVATTLSGYTPYSPQLEGPDLQLVRDLVEAGITVVAEGRIRTPGEMRQALERGALAVTVGSAIAPPELITQTFLEVLKPA